MAGKSKAAGALEAYRREIISDGIEQRIADLSDAVAAYAAAKGPYFEGAYPRVLEWAESTGWQPE